MAPRSNAKQSAALDPALPQKKRARRRVVGALAVCVAAAIVLPVVLDSEPRQIRECGIFFLHVVLFSDQLANGADGQEHSERVRRQWLEPVAFVKRLAARNAVGIAAVEHIEHDDGDANGVGRNGNAP